MKKNLLMALAVATMFASCSKQDDGGTNDKAGKIQSLSVKIDMSKFTKSDDASFDAIPAWNNILLVVTKADGTFVMEKSYSKTEFDAITNGKVALIEAGKVDLTNGKVTAYITTEGNTWGALTAVAATANLPLLAKDQLDINNWQASGKIKTDIAGTFANIPYYGQGTIAKAGVNTDGHELLEATVSVTPELSRIQVINTPKSGGVANNQTVVDLKVIGVYINQITSNGDVQDIRTQGGTAVESGTWESSYYTGSNALLLGMHDRTTDKGYQIFDGDKPHVIVKVTYQLATGGLTGNTVYTKYLTITKFKVKDSADTAGDLTVSKGKIYNIDLSALVPTYTQTGDDPYDNTTYYDLIATVTVNQWTNVNITPEL